MVRPDRPEILLFELGGQRFGVYAARVQELVRACTMFSVPLAPAVVEGVLNLRGRIVPVIDIRARLGLPPKAPEISDHLIITRARGTTLGLRVDRALELVAHDVNGEMPEQVGEPVRVLNLAGGLATVLDPQLLLSPAESDALNVLVAPLAVEKGGR